MEGFIRLFSTIMIEVGIDPRYIFFKSGLELPGYFRPTKEWDLLIVKDGQLLAAIEAKSHVGPSFGNNFNNRTEEAMGAALDLWTAYREGAFNESVQPFLGYFLMLENCSASNIPIKVREPHFKVFPEFVNSSYAKRYEIFCRKLVRERHYSAAAFITSQVDSGLKGEFQEPVSDLSLVVLAKALIAHVSAYVS